MFTIQANPIQAESGTKCLNLTKRKVCRGSWHVRVRIFGILREVE